MLFNKRFLLVAEKNKMLSSAIAQLFSTDASFKGVSIDVYSQLNSCADMEKKYSLVIFLSTYPISTLVPQIARHCGKETKKLLVLNSEDRPAIRHLIQLGMDGVISIESSFQELKTAVHTIVVHNLKYISPLLVSSFSDFSAHNQFSALSKKELDIALCLTDGKRNVDIASELNISPKTVHTYKSRIYKKLGVDNNMQLLKMSLQDR